MSIDKNSRAARQMKSRGKRPPRGRRRVSWKAILLAVILILAAAACGAVYYVNYLLGRTQDVGVKMCIRDRYFPIPMRLQAFSFPLIRWKKSLRIIRIRW